MLLVRDVGGLRSVFFVHKLSIFLGIGDFASKVVCYTNLSEGWKLQTERKKQRFVKSYVINIHMDMKMSNLLSQIIFDSFEPQDKE